MKTHWSTPGILALALILTTACAKNENENVTETVEQPEPGVAASEQAPSGEDLYLANCASCHDQVMYKAPSRLFVGMTGAENILNAMNGGLMAGQAAGLDADGRRAIAEFLSGQNLDNITEPLQPPACDDQHGFDASLTPISTGWGTDPQNTRFQADPTLYFGDLLARAYAISARTGELRWVTKVDDHRDATITGSPSLSGERLFVPVSSLEVVLAADPGYVCCTFRGSVVALDIANGTQIWKTYSIDEPPDNAGTNSAGTPILAPSGAPVWTSPTLDLKRGRLYVGTGENYSSPADGNSDAIIALDMETGDKVWVSQQTSGDAWNAGCLSEATNDHAGCPEENGPDYDFGSSPILITLENGQDIVVGGQKSGDVMGIDPESGQTLWKTGVGRGGVQGGVHFGMAAEGTRIFAPINDMYYPEDDARYAQHQKQAPGLYALNAGNGELLWSSPAPDLCAGLQGCDPGISQAITAIPGAVIAGHLDGRLRIYSAQDGELLWELNTLREFDSVSGEKARGGSFSGDGGIVADGMIYINSGYGIYNHMPGNVLMAIGPAG